MAAAIAGIAAGVIGLIGSMSAADTQAQAQEQAAQTQLQMFNTITGQEQPFLSGGYGAENALLYGLGIPSSTPYGGGGWGQPGAQGMSLGAMGRGGPGGMGIGLAPGARPGGPVAGAQGMYGGMGFGQLMAPPTTAALENFPGFQFALNTGGQAVRNADTPGVGALSGPALKDLTNFDVGTSLSQAWAPYQDWQSALFSRLSAVAGLGQNAAGNLGNTGAQLGTGIAQAQAAAGASRAAGIVGGANAATTPLWAYYLQNSGGGGGGTSSSDILGGNSTSISDRRLKTNIRRIGTAFNGLPIYTFAYRGTNTLHVGVMADEVESTKPDAVVVDEHGYKMVDYAKAF